MDERREKIIRLLETRDDHLPQPSCRDHAPSGFVHHQEHRTSCPDCLANDRTMFGCETCGGRGYVEELVAVDPYAVTSVQPYGLDVRIHERRKERDAQIERLMAQTREPWQSPEDELADANAHPEAWETARRRMYQHYDYGWLDKGLELLRDSDEAAYRLLHSVYVYRWLTDISTTVEAVMERGLAFLSEFMPEQFRAPDAEPEVRVVGQVERAAGPVARNVRDQKILELAVEGKTPAEIAVRCHVSIRTVYSVVQAAA